MHNPASVRDNQTHRLLCNYVIQTDQQTSVRQPDLIIINKKRICRNVDFAFPVDHGVKLKECEKKDNVTSWVASVSMGVGASQRIPLFLCETHTKGLRPRSPSRPEENEGQRIEEEDSRNERTVKRDTVNRREQQRSVDRTAQSRD